MALLLGLLLSGCALHHESFSKSDLPTTPNTNLQINLQGQQPMALANWWQSFNDPQLNQLIQQAIDKNFDIAIAYWQWQTSRAQAGVINAERKPAISAELAGNQQRSLSQNSDTATSKNTWTATLEADWQIDLWGRLQYSADAARAQMRASEADYQGVWISVLSDVADQYFQWQTLEQQKQLTNSSIALLLSIEKIAQQRFDVGASNRLDWTRAQAERQQQQASVHSLAAQQQAIQQQLALLGGAPTLPLTLSSRLIAPTLPGELNVNLLERRPDILRAREQLAAAWSQQQVAQVAHLPSLSLLGSVGSASRSLGNLFSRDSNVYQINGSLAGILWQGERFKSALAAADANHKSVALVYQRTVLAAIAEVDTLIMQYDQNQQRVIQLRAASQLQQQALDIAKLRYEQGEDDLLTVLDAERNLLSMQTALITAESDWRRDLIQLYQSLGGGWPTGGKDGSA